MTFRHEAERVGCLFIDDFVSGQIGHEASVLASGVPGIETLVFQSPEARGLWERLQTALQELRAKCGGCAIMAVGTGCAAALALACQLPVERIVLIDPALPVRKSHSRIRSEAVPEAGRLYRAVRRLAAFARRNLTLCVCDMLVVEHARNNAVSDARRAFGTPVNCRVRRLLVQQESEKELYTIREFAVKQAISRFLQCGEAPKPLAEISEMCIIYG